MDSRPQCDLRASAHTLVLLLKRQAFDMEFEAPKMHRVLPSPSELTPETATRLRPESCHDGAAERAAREWADNTEA